MILFDTPGIIEKKRTKLEERMMMAVVSAELAGRLGALQRRTYSSHKSHRNHGSQETAWSHRERGTRVMVKLW